MRSPDIAEYPIHNIPPSLRSVPQWVCWRSVDRDGRPTKEPIDPHSGHLAKTNDSSTWSDFDTAWRHFQSSPGTSGIGFVFTADDPFAGVDIDDCLDEAGNYIWGGDIISSFDTYVEVSPSGTGVKVFLTGVKPSFAQCRKDGFGPLMVGKVEVYDKELKRRGWTTKQWVTKQGDHRGGRSFTKNAVYKLLTNVTYIGKIRYKDETHEGEHEAIVPAELFQRVQSQLKANGQSGGTGVRNKHNALLKGLIWCKACGRPMTHSYSCKGTKRYRYYVCGTAMQQGWSECPSPSVPAAEIEQFVTDQIRSIGDDERLTEKIMEQIASRSDQQIANLQSEQKSLHRQLQVDHERLRAIAVSTTNHGRVAGLPELQSRIDAASDRLRETEAALRSLRDQAIDLGDVKRLLSSFDELWQTISPREQVRLTSLLIDRVEFDGVGGNIAITFHETGLQSLAVNEAEVPA